jgi:hypothetical protein
MATIEERLQALEQEHERLHILEQEHSQLKKTIELQTIAIGALVNKATLEKLNEKYDKIFDTLIAHDSFTNGQLAELRTQQIETDGKIVGLQTEMRQRFTEQDSKFDTRLNQVDTRLNQVDTRLNQVDTRLNQVETLLTQILARLPEQKQ